MAIKKGDKLKVEYEGSFDDGTVFDSSKHGDHSHPLEFEVGSGRVIKGFEQAVLGMKKNEEKEFKVKPSEAYGDYNPKLVQKIPRDMLPKEQEPKPGMVLAMSDKSGNVVHARITEVNDKQITIDLNNPLAGKNLNFKIKIVEIESGVKNAK